MKRDRSKDWKKGRINAMSHEGVISKPCKAEGGALRSLQPGDILGFFAPKQLPPWTDPNLRGGSYPLDD